MGMGTDFEKERQRAVEQLEARRAVHSAEADRIGQDADEAVALRELQTLVAHYVAARYELTDVAPVRLGDETWSALDYSEARGRFDLARAELRNFIVALAESWRRGSSS